MLLRSSEKPILWIVGTPLDDSSLLSTDAVNALSRSIIVIGESRKATYRWLSQTPCFRQKQVYLLDRIKDTDWEEIYLALKAIKGGTGAALLSDTGMPMLFDPGREILEFCRKSRFQIRSVPAATSWGTAAALSGFAPPFFVAGFAPREEQARKRWLSSLADEAAHLILMDTPYRFHSILTTCLEVFGHHRQTFLGWELAKQTERLIWGTLSEIKNMANDLQLQKGEFVLVITGINRGPKRT